MLPHSQMLILIASLSFLHLQHRHPDYIWPIKCWGFIGALRFKTHLDITILCLSHIYSAEIRMDIKRLGDARYNRGVALYY